MKVQTFVWEIAIMKLWKLWKFVEGGVVLREVWLDMGMMIASLGAAILVASPSSFC